eukprot:4111617-Amphidinium_carterae.2
MAAKTGTPRRTFTTQGWTKLNRVTARKRVHTHTHTFCESSTSEVLRFEKFLALQEGRYPATSSEDVAMSALC